MKSRPTGGGFAAGGRTAFGEVSARFQQDFRRGPDRAPAEAPARLRPLVKRADFYGEKGAKSLTARRLRSGKKVEQKGFFGEFQRAREGAFRGGERSDSRSIAGEGCRLRGGIAKGAGTNSLRRTEIRGGGDWQGCWDYWQRGGDGIAGTGTARIRCRRHRRAAWLGL